MNDLMVKNNCATSEKSLPAPRRLTFTPRVDILELADRLVLQLDMPGVKPDDVEVHFERGELVVKGTRKVLARPIKTQLVEYEAGDYYRAFLISQDVAADRITAELKHGVLTVELPRSEAALPRKISVKSA